MADSQQEKADRLESGFESDSPRAAVLIFSVRAVLVVLCAVFLALIVEAFRIEPFSEAFATIAGLRWGVVTLVDLYLGFALFSILIALLEGSWRKGLVCMLLSCFIGNAVGIVWVCFRLRRWWISGQRDRRAETYPPTL